MGKQSFSTFYTARFITRIGADNNSASVAFFGMCCLRDKHMIIGESMDDFIDILVGTKGKHPTVVYVHDFDYSAAYIIHALLDHGAVLARDFNFSSMLGFDVFRTKEGQMYMIKLYFKLGYDDRRTCVICSSKNKTHSSISELGASFGCDVDSSNIIDTTLQLNYDDVLSDDDMNECLRSTYVLADVMYKLRKEGLSALTIGSDAMDQWLKLDKGMADLLPTLDHDLDAWMRPSYRGGYAWISDSWRYKNIYEGIVLDVNSLYPYVMRNFPLPVGIPKLYSYIDELRHAGINKKSTLKSSISIKYVNNCIDDDAVITCPDGGCFIDRFGHMSYINGPDGFSIYFGDVCTHYFIAECIVSCDLKDGHLPTISNMAISGCNTKVNQFVPKLQDDTVVLTGFDLELLLTHYNIDQITLVSIAVFDHKLGLFNNFIDKHYEIKRTASGASRCISKLMLDSLYGRFGIRINRKTAYPVLDDGIVKYREGKVFEDKIIRYLPIAVFISSIARWCVIATAQQCYDRVVYMDTDSVHLVGTSIPDCFDIGDGLGAWKVEAVFSSALYLGIKTYIHDEYKIDNAYTENYNIINNGLTSTVVKMAGAPEVIRKQVNWSNFAYNAQFDGKVVVTAVPGGAKRTYHKYTITQHR